MNIEATSKNKHTKLHILVATRNRPSDLRRLLESLKRQINRNFSITIVDSSDIEKEAVGSLQEDFNELDIHLHHTLKLGSCTQRNMGLSLISDDVILISDDDCVYESNTIEQVFRYIDINPKIAAFGLNVIEKRSRKYQYVQFIKRIFGISNQGRNYLVRKNGINVFGNKNKYNKDIEWIGSTALVIVKSRIHDKTLLEFNVELEHLSGYASGEDVYLTYKLFLHGYKLGISNEAFVHHLPSSKARDNEELIYKVRSYNRFILWKDLIYKGNKLSIFSFIFSNAILTVQYSIRLLQANLDPIRGHLNAMTLLYKTLRGK